MVELEIRCLPRDLPEFIEVDISQGTLDTVIHLSQVVLPKNVEMVAVIHGPEDDLPVISIHQPKIVAEEEEAATPEGETPEASGSAEENKTEE